MLEVELNVEPPWQVVQRLGVEELQVRHPGILQMKQTPLALGAELNGA